MDHEVARRYAWCRTGVPAPNADEVLAALNELDAALARVAELEAIGRAAEDYVMAGLCGNEPADQRAKLAALVEVARTDR